MTALELLFSTIYIAAVGIISLRTKILDKTGVIAAIFVGGSILIFGGEKWFLLLLTFHFIAAYFTRYKHENKNKVETAEAKGGIRDWKNVLANGVTASVLAICFRLTLLKQFAASYLGVISISIADTLATELGLLSHNEPRLITNLQVKVKAGVSGGITLLGEIASLFGSFIISLIAIIVNFGGLTIFQILINSFLIGFLGCNLDSLLGATIQIVRKCKVCGKVTEKKIHCKQPAEYSKGIKFIDNNMVNFISTIFGAVFVILTYPYVS